MTAQAGLVVPAHSSVSTELSPWQSEKVGETGVRALGTISSSNARVSRGGPEHSIPSPHRKTRRKRETLRERRILIKQTPVFLGAGAAQHGADVLRGRGKVHRQLRQEGQRGPALARGDDGSALAVFFFCLFLFPFFSCFFSLLFSFLVFFSPVFFFFFFFSSFFSSSPILTRVKLAGGTFTISNGGVFGSLMGTPILNPPQSAILGMHATKQRAVVA